MGHNTTQTSHDNGFCNGRIKPNCSRIRRRITRFETKMAFLIILQEKEVMGEKKFDDVTKTGIITSYAMLRSLLWVAHPDRRGGDPASTKTKGPEEVMKGSPGVEAWVWVGVNNRKRILNSIAE